MAPLWKQPARPAHVAILVHRSMLPGDHPHAGVLQLRLGLGLVELGAGLKSQVRALMDQPRASILESSSDRLRRRNPSDSPSASTEALAGAESAVVSDLR